MVWKLLCLWCFLLSHLLRMPFIEKFCLNRLFAEMFSNPFREKFHATSSNRTCRFMAPSALCSCYSPRYSAYILSQRLLFPWLSPLSWSWCTSRCFLHSRVLPLPFSSSKSFLFFQLKPHLLFENLPGHSRSF